jgi:pyruvate kinase
MLSDETASGKFPLQAVEVMKRVIIFTEASEVTEVDFTDMDDIDHSRAMASAVINLAANMHAKAIVAETKSGATALQIASHRPSISVIAVTPDAQVAQQLALVYGVKSYIRPAVRQAANKLTDWLHQHKLLQKGDIIVTASGKYPGVVGTTDTIKVRVL